MPNPLRRLLPARFRKDGPVIPVVRLTGAIAAGGSALRPSLSIGSTAALLERAFSVKSAPAVALVINSPGGSAVQSRLIHERIRVLASEKDKQVLVFVEDVAASGGYMIACAGDEIHADPSSIVGSIGVVMASFGLTGLIERIGVERRVHTAGENKFTLDPFQPERPQDIAHIDTMLAEIHEVFIALVKARRGTKLADNPDLFSGQFWVGETARKLGLVDGIGDIRSVLRAKFGEKVEMKLVSAPRSLLGRRSVVPGMAMEQIGAGAVDATLGLAEDQALWGRFGLSAPR